MSGWMDGNENRERKDGHMDVWRDKPYDWRGIGRQSNIPPLSRRTTSLWKLPSHHLPAPAVPSPSLIFYKQIEHYMVFLYD